MENEKPKNQKVLKRRNITLIVSAILLFLSAVSFVLMLLQISYMNIIFFVIAGLSGLTIIFLLLWLLNANEKYKKLAKVLMFIYIFILFIGTTGFIVFLGLIFSGSDFSEAFSLFVESLR